MTGHLLVLSLLLPAPASARPRPTALRLSAQYSRYAGACRRRVPLEDVGSFPVPVRTAAGLRWRLFFYPAEGEGTARLVYPPSAVVEFDGNGRGADCSVTLELPEAPPEKPLGPQLTAAAGRLDAAAYAAKEAALYAALEAAGKAFVERQGGAAARRAARGALSLFAAVSEPALKAWYRALSPEFWAWAEAAAGP